MEAVQKQSKKQEKDGKKKKTECRSLTLLKLKC